MKLEEICDSCQYPRHCVRHGKCGKPQTATVKTPEFSLQACYDPEFVAQGVKNLSARLATERIIMRALTTATGKDLDDCAALYGLTRGKRFHFFLESDVSLRNRCIKAHINERLSRITP